MIKAFFGGDEGGTDPLPLECNSSAHDTREKRIFLNPIHIFYYQHFCKLCKCGILYIQIFHLSSFIV